MAPCHTATHVIADSTRCHARLDVSGQRAGIARAFIGVEDLARFTGRRRSLSVKTVPQARALRSGILRADDRAPGKDQANDG